MNRTTTFSELKKTVTLAIPLIFTQLLSHVLPVVDTVMAGREPPAVLASVALGTQIFVLIYLFMIGIALVITTQIARHQGAGDRLRIRRSFQQGVWLTAILGALTVVVTLAAAWVPQLIGSAPDIAQGARAYILFIAPGAGLFVCSLAARYFLDGMSHPRTSILVQLGLIPVNIVGNYVLLKGLGPIPPLGAAGMAIATSLCHALYALAMFHAVWRNPRWQPYWTLGYPVYGGRPRGDAGRGGFRPAPSMAASIGRPRSQAPVQSPPVPSHRPMPWPVAAGGGWVRDDCAMLPPREACARLRDRRSEIRTRFFNAMPSERDVLRVEERTINARLDNDCGGH